MSYLEMKTISLELGQSSLPCPRWMIKEDKFQMALSGTQGISGSGMDKATKQYRQYIFKVNHKLSRKAARLGDASVADSHKVRGMLRAASKVQSQLQDSFPSAEPLWPWIGHLACILSPHQAHISISMDSHAAFESPGNEMAHSRRYLTLCLWLDCFCWLL